MNWPSVSLKEVLRLEIDAVPVHADVTYRFAGVYSFGRGLFERGPIDGSETTYKVFHRLHTDQFVMSQVKGWEGALARVTSEFDGFFLSPVYPTFVVDSVRLDPGYLAFFFRQSTTWTMLERMSRGIGARRNSVYPDMLLSIEIPLPPLAEQRRIVAKIERLVGKIEEARGLREQVERDAQRLLVSMYHEIIDGAPNEPLQEVAPLNRRPVVVEPDGVYPQVSARSFGKGTFHNPPVKGSDLTWQKPYWVKANDILISNIKAWEGAIAVAKPEDDGRVASHRYLTCVPIVGKATARFVSFHLLTPDGLSLIRDASPGTADRNRTLNTKLLQKIPVPVPPYRQQLEFDRLCMHVEKLKSIQSQSTAELDALLPAILDRAFRGAL